MWQQNGMDTKLQLLSSKDVGRVAAEAFLQADKEDYKNKAISLAGDDLTPRQAGQVFKELTGQDIPYTYDIVGRGFKWMMPNEVGKMFAWFQNTGYSADVAGLKKRYPFMKDFRKWLEEESAWRKPQEEPEDHDEDE